MRGGSVDKSNPIKNYGKLQGKGGILIALQRKKINLSKREVLRGKPGLDKEVGIIEGFKRRNNRNKAVV